MTGTWVTPEDTAVRRLLADAGLPTADLERPHQVRFIASGLPGAPDGVIGLECFGGVGLLRSLAVAPDRRQRGVGMALVQAVESAAVEAGVRELFLLTTTAEAFFAALGYSRVDRARVPAAIRGTAEFSSLCPSTAAVMAKRVGTVSA